MTHQGPAVAHYHLDLVKRSTLAIASLKAVLPSLLRIK